MGDSTSAQTGNIEEPGMAWPGRLAPLPCFLQIGSTCQRFLYVANSTTRGR